MSQSLKALISTGNKINWAIGQTRSDIALPVNDVTNNNQAVVFDYKGMKILYRGAYFTLLQSEYPEAYAQLGAYYGNSPIVGRTFTGQTEAKWLDSNGNIIIVVGDGGKISRSVDGGVTSATVTSPTTTNLKRIRYIPALSKWIIPYTTNKCLISTDATGSSFTDTTVTGLSVDLSTETNEVRFGYIGNIMVLCTFNKTFVSTNGTAWTAVLTDINHTNRRLTIGNGYFVIVSHSGGNHYFTYSTDGSNWNAYNGLWSHDAYAGIRSYGMVYDGSRWVFVAGAMSTSEYLSTYPTSGSPPPSNYWVEPTGSVNVMSYTANGNPGSSLNIKYYSWGGSYYTNWLNWKSGVGTTQYWYYPGYNNLWINGPTARCLPNAGAFTFSNINDYFDIYQNNNVVSGSNANEYYSAKIAGTWNSSTPGSAISPQASIWSSTISTWYGYPYSQSGVTADSYYFRCTQGTAGVVQLSGSITNPSIIIGPTTSSQDTNYGFHAYNARYLRIG